MTIPIYNGGILMIGGAIAIDPECCCDPPCDNCLTLDSFGYEEDDFLIAIYLTAASLSPTYVCDGTSGTLSFSITNNTGDAWGTCPSPEDPDCAVTADFFGTGSVIEVTSAPGGTITSSGSDSFVNWYDEAFSVGQTKTYEINFNMIGCSPGGFLNVDVYYGRGYRGTISMLCIPCDEVPE
jgi:hypothetical protein